MAAFGQGALDHGEMAEIETHLAVCESCCDLLSTLPDDEFVDRLRASQRLPGWTTAFCGDASVAASVHADSEATGFEVPSSFVFSDLSSGSEIPLTVNTVGRSGPGPREFPLEQELPSDLLNHPRYRIVRKLGAGGMGSVYLAQHQVMDRPVALKVIRSDLLGKPALVERFRREVKSAAHLALHPNIVAAYDAEQAGDSHFLVMEFVDGVNLGDLVKSQGPLPVEAACDAIRQAAEGLEHAHQRGMVHRDIKPQNLMRTANGQIKILDFGLARLASEVLPDLAAAAEEDEQQHVRSITPDGGIKLTLTDMVLGSADYIAPEQAIDPRSADIRADIYSLGCTLYYLLAGQPPFPDGNLSQKLAAHAERAPQPLAELRPDVPAELTRIVDRMMAKDRDHRFQRPAELSEVLARFCARKAEPNHHHDELRERPRATVSRADAKAALVKPSDVGVSRKGAPHKPAIPYSQLEIQSGPPPWPIRYATYWRRRPWVKVASFLSLLVVVAGTLTITLVLTNRGNLPTDAPAASLAVASAPAAPPMPRTSPDANSLSSPSPGDTQSITSRLKDATVYLKAKIAGKTVPLGSGFVIETNGDRVMVVTNSHIAIPDPSKLLDPPAPTGSKVELEAVFHSGEGRRLEQVLPAEIIAADAPDDPGNDLAADLAFLIVQGVSQPPQPINPLTNVEPREGMPYTSAGVPMRGMDDKSAKTYANPSVTITNGYITTLERNDSGQLTLLQAIAPPLPYNTGGPVVEENSGRLIGVFAAMFGSDEYDLRLLSSARGATDIPTGGKDLMIVAAVDNVLHFRAFDRHGKLVVNTDEKNLTHQTPQIEDLRKQLVGLWPPHALSVSEKDHVIAAVTSIVGYAGSDETIISVVPAEEVRRCLAGRVGAIQLKWLDTSLTTTIEIKAQVVDPKRLVKSVLVRVAPAAGGGSLAPDSDGNWPPLPNASPVELQKDEKTRTASGKVQVSLTGQDDSGRIILIQPAHRDDIGQVIYSKPIEFQPPEREGPDIPPRTDVASHVRPASEKSPRAATASETNPTRFPQPKRFEFGPLARRPVKVKEKLDKILASSRSHAAKVIIPAGMYELTRSQNDRRDGPRKYVFTERRFESPSNRVGAKFYLISGATSEMEVEPRLAAQLDLLNLTQLDKKPAILTVGVTESGDCGLVSLAILENSYPRLRGGMVPDIVYETLAVTGDGSKPAIGDDRDWENERMFKLAKYYKGQLRAYKQMWETMQTSQAQAQMGSIWANVMREAAAQDAAHRALQRAVGGR